MKQIQQADTIYWQTNIHVGTFSYALKRNVKSRNQKGHTAYGNHIKMKTLKGFEDQSIRQKKSFNTNPLTN
ncbi:hypothetical protein [Prevotella sp. BV3P1]|uniref:hypothetical protein n=1 Tax=Prevotella sp. BV3P1 TaxID=1111130 RepID=UPI00042669BC|nr:hypothetical protein [Prevotella sp. BV3P1]KGF40830.1 hypothetical protein HMPREF2140_06390 [Hoylesella buccalis DNF00985]